VSELVKGPFPVPSEVLLLAIVGDAVVFQQTPLAVTEAPPSSDMFPPVVAVVAAIELALMVVSVGALGSFTDGVHPVKTIDKATNTNKERILKLIFFCMPIN